MFSRSATTDANPSTVSVAGALEGTPDSTAAVADAAADELGSADAVVDVPAGAAAHAETASSRIAADVVSLKRGCMIRL
jgi:hypothetical protein